MSLPIMNSREIRDLFFKFFVSHKHTFVPSSSLIPAKDPTLLFANAGMNQFKDVFLGKEARSYTRAVSIQKCIRAGGKHNDLDNVGFTKRHLTFFEMMGNFSFGDYFKKEAISYAWEFVTHDLKIPTDKLYATVFFDDQESYDIWTKDIKLDSSRVVKLGAQDNFWQMGETGPCGPCSEIYIDRGISFGCGQANCAPGCSCDRFLEFWNLVFMQYDRQPDGSDVPLKKTGVDTGMGFERLCAILQNKESVFDTDIFAEIMHDIEQHTGKKYNSDINTQTAFRVLADHIRSVSFALADGATPSNEGRGYVLRKIIRRAALFSQKLSDNNFFYKLVDPLVKSLGTIYPELVTHQELIKTIIKDETERFTHNLTTGKVVFEKYLEELEKTSSKILSGEYAFKLYDTYGFPLELTRVLTRERNFDVDLAGFEQEMEKQRERSAQKDMFDIVHAPKIDLETEFVGYEELAIDTKITGLLVSTVLVDEAPEGQDCIIITKESPFYAESGGQVADIGDIVIKDIRVPVQKIFKLDKAVGLLIKTPINLKLGMTASLNVSQNARLNTAKNHSATHLLQAGLIHVLGSQVRQSGSFVCPDYGRFDFTFMGNITPEQLKAVETYVNNSIQENILVEIYETNYEKALEAGVTALFGEKYNPECVRVVDINGYSQELCGGTHVCATGDIGCFKITEYSALAAGVKRIVAVTGPQAVKLYQELFDITKTLGNTLKVKTSEILDTLEKQREELKIIQTHVKTLKKSLWQAEKSDWLKQKEHIGSLEFLHVNSLLADQTDLRDIASVLSCDICLVTTQKDQKTFFYCALSPKALTIDTQKLISWLKEQGVQGGGSKNSLQGNFPAHNQIELVKKLKLWLTKNL